MNRPYTHSFNLPISREEWIEFPLLLGEGQGEVVASAYGAPDRSVYSFGKIQSSVVLRYHSDTLLPLPPSRQW